MLRGISQFSMSTPYPRESLSQPLFIHPTLFLPSNPPFEINISILQKYESPTSDFKCGIAYVINLFPPTNLNSMRPRVTTKGKRKSVPATTPEKKDFTILQTQSTVHQLLEKIKEEDEDSENIKQGRMRKQSGHSIMSENLFDQIEEMSFMRGKKKGGKDDRAPLDIEAKKICVKKALIKQLVIISSFRIKPLSLGSDMMNYYYQKPVKSASSYESRDKKEKAKFFTLILMMDIYRKYSKSYHLGYKFYAMYAQSLFLFTCDKASGSGQMIAYCPDNGLSKILIAQKIRYEILPTIKSGQIVMISNRYISVFWNYFLNEIILNDNTFQLNANFDFINSSRAQPIEMFNGIQTREMFKNSKEFCEYQQIHHLKIQGLMTEQNIRNIAKKLEQKDGAFMFEFKYVEGSDQIQKSLDTFKMALNPEE